MCACEKSEVLCRESIENENLEAWSSYFTDAVCRSKHAPPKKDAELGCVYFDENSEKERSGSSRVRSERLRGEGRRSLAISTVDSGARRV